MEVVHTATATAPAASASDAPKDRRDDTTEEYPIAEDGHDDGNHSDNDVSHPPSGCDENQEGGAKQGAPESRKQNGVRRKKRKRKRREQPIPLPVVGPGEVLVPIHTVWSRGKRMKGGHVVKRDDAVERYIDSKGTVYNCDGKGFQYPVFTTFFSFFSPASRKGFQCPVLTAFKKIHVRGSSIHSRVVVFSSRSQYSHPVPSIHSFLFFFFFFHHVRGSSTQY